MSPKPFTYHYHPETYAYINKDLADESPLEPGIFLVPAYATLQPIPDISIPDTHFIKWNLIEQSWNIVEKPIIDNSSQNTNNLETISEEPVNPVDLLRIKRNNILAQWDWVTLRALSGGPPLTDEWIAYLKALRDLPENSNPTLTSMNTLDETSIIWPSTPSIPGTI